jgi:hypothetical protein
LSPYFRENTLHPLQRSVSYAEKEIIAVYRENHTKPTNTHCGQNTELLIVETGGTYSYHWALKG